MKRKILNNGYFPEFELFGVPIFVHWTFPAGGAFLALFLGRFELGYILPLIYAYSILILVHEFGHAFGAWRAGMRVYKISIDGGGGWCYADEPWYFRELLVFYAGGVIAQIVLLMVTLSFIFTFGQPTTTGLSLVVFVFTYVNIITLVINLIPYRDNDGAKLLHIIRLRLK